MSQFQKKLTELKQTLIKTQLQTQNHSNPRQPCTHTCSAIQLKVSKPKQQLCIQQPIIIQKKSSVISRQHKNKTVNDVNNINAYNIGSSEKVASRMKKSSTTNIQTKVDPFVPVHIPTRDKKNNYTDLQTEVTVPSSNKCNNKEILIHIDKDQNKNKECLKKLFKKIHRLTQDLANSQKQRIRLQLQLENYKRVSRTCSEHQKIINKLEGDNFKLNVELDMLRRTMKQRDIEVERIRIEFGRTPKQIIKEIIVQKPVQIIIEVPKLIPGPQRIVQKLVQVPKYIEVQKKVIVEVTRQVPRQITRTIQVPTIIEKPVYIDKPIYIDRPIEVQRRVEVPIEVPIEVPLYVDRPCVEDQSFRRIQYLERQLEILLQENAALHGENNELRLTIQKLDQNLNVLRRHNQEKNREVEILLHNSMDYQPISPSGERSFGSVKYTVSPNPYRRII